MAGTGIVVGVERIEEETGFHGMTGFNPCSLATSRLELNTEN
jgi:hypothetical protein